MALLLLFTTAVCLTLVTSTPVDLEEISIEKKGESLERRGRPVRSLEPEPVASECHPENEYMCPDSTSSCNCHNIHTLCDGIQDCSSGIDENPEFCHSQCTNIHGWWCEKHGRCIHRLSLCTGNKTCGRISDKRASCNATLCPEELGYTRCNGRSKQCVRISDVCSGGVSPCKNGWMANPEGRLCSSVNTPATSPVPSTTPLPPTTPVPTPNPEPGTFVRGVYVDCSHSQAPTTVYSNSATPIRSAQGLTGDVSICQATLYSHNKVRQNHVETPHLVYSDSLAETAEAWSVHIASTGVFSHSSSTFRNGAGENLYYAGTSGPQVYSISDAAYSWYNEVNNYNFATGTGSGVIGHFTQMVWSNTVEIGCGVAERTSGSWRHTYITCHYNPPGNYIGQNLANVQGLVSNPAMPSSAGDLLL